jgi:RNA polymerase sigma-70 factor (ECF subfamily)
VQWTGGVGASSRKGGSPGVENWVRIPLSTVVDEAKESNPADEAVRLHFEQIYRYLLRRSGSSQDAEELTQRVFVDAAAGLDPNNPPDSLLSWLYAVAERRFIDEIRRRARMRDVIVRLEDVSVESFEYGDHVSTALQAGLSRLSDESRHVVVRKLFQGWSFQEIAAEVGSSQDACKMRFSRALRQLRDSLRDEGLS